MLATTTQFGGDGRALVRILEPVLGSETYLDPRNQVMGVNDGNRIFLRRRNELLRISSEGAEVPVCGT